MAALREKSEVFNKDLEKIIRDQRELKNTSEINTLEGNFLTYNVD